MSESDPNSSGAPEPGAAEADSPPPEMMPGVLDSRIQHGITQGLSPSQALGSAVASKRNVWEPPDPAVLQAEFPSFKVLDLLGRGGMGAVYLGWQISLERYVAIKILPPDLDDGDAGYVERFKREAKTMAKLQHPGIVAVIDTGQTTSGLLYFVMEYIEGTDVAQMIKSEGRLTPDSALAIVVHVCDALHYAHGHGVIHRDIKPANIMVNKEGLVKVADFGLAKAAGSAQMGLTRSDMSMGTPDFVAPEALMMGVVVDHRADLYAIGVMLYNMLTGEIPRGRFRMPGEKVGTDVRFDAIIDRAMEQDRIQRYQSAAEIRRDLDIILSTPIEKIRVEEPAPAPQQQQQPPPREAVPAKKGAGPRGPTAPAAGGSSTLPGKKSSSGMIIGVLGGIAVLGIGAFFVFKKPVAVDASTAASSESASPATAPSSAPDAAAWHDGIADFVETLHGNWPPRARAEGSGIFITEFKSVAFSLKALTDFALRVTAHGGPGRAGWNVQFRAHDTNSAYYAVVLSPTSGVLNVAQDNKPKPLKSFDLPPGFDVTRSHTTEIRAIGDHLTVALDGAPVVDLHDATHGSGHFYVTGQPGTVFEKIEYRELPAVPAPVAHVAATSSPANGAPALQSATKEEPWQDLLHGPGKLALYPGATLAGGILTLPGKNGAGASLLNKSADGALRVTTTFAPGSPGPALRARESLKGRYYLEIENTTHVKLARVEGATYAPIQSFAFSPALEAGRDYTLEFHAVGPVLTAKLNGVTLGTVRDETYATGPFSLANFKPGLSIVKSLDFLPLPPTAGPASGVPADGTWEDLLATLTPEVVARTGQGWHLESDGLHSPAKKYGTLPLPGTFANTSYQVRITLWQITPKDAFHLVLPVGDRMAGFELDGYEGQYTGLGMINGRYSKQQPDVVEGKQVKDSKPHELELAVRLDGANAKVTATLDARPLYAWTGPIAALSQHPFWAAATPGFLALSSSTNDWVVSAVKAKRLEK